MDILDSLLLRELQEIAKTLELDIASGMKKEELKSLISDSLEEHNSELAYGTLDILADGFGFLRNTTVGKDIYLSSSQIKKFNLRSGDYVFGEVRRPAEYEKNYALRRIFSANDTDLDVLEKKKPFEDLIPTYPREQFILGGNKENISGRILDLVAPIGKGQRALIIAPPKAGKTTFISTIANALIKEKNNADVWILLIDERPEEVTDITENVKGATVFSSTFDDEVKNHIRVTEKVLEKAKARVEEGKNIVILLDSLTRLTRAYNTFIPSGGKILSGGIDPAAFYFPKNFFGAARNIKDGGSLTIIATILVETGSKMDEVIYEEFKSTGNCDIYLDRQLAEFRIFPAIDILKSGTRKEELLIEKSKLSSIWKMRRLLNEYDNKVNATSALIKLIQNTKDNDELLKNIDSNLKSKK